MIEEADLWQTGGDLISAKSGIILHPLEDRTVRDLTAAPVAAAVAVTCLWARKLRRTRWEMHR